MEPSLTTSRKQSANPCLIPNTDYRPNRGQVQHHNMNWQEFFSMGGYGLYVWLSYGLMAVVLILNVLQPLRRKAELMRSVRQFLDREDKKTRQGGAV